MSVLIYAHDSPKVVSVQPYANRISVNELNLAFGANVVALQILNGTNVIQQFFPRKKKSDFRRKGGWNVASKIVAVFGRGQRNTKRKRPRKNKEKPPKFITVVIDNITETIPVKNGGKITCDDVDRVFGDKVHMLQFIQGTKAFMSVPRKTRCFKLPKLNWDMPFDVEPIYENAYDVVEINIDNGKSVDVRPNDRGELTLTDKLFGYEVQALDITYQDMIYRHKPIRKSTFKEPDWGWDECEYVKAVLVTPIVPHIAVDYDAILDDYPSHYYDYMRYDDFGFETDEENKNLFQPAIRQSWKAWFAKRLLFFIGIYMVYKWRAEVYKMLLFMTDPLPKHGWVSWLWTPSKNRQLDPPSQIFNHLWERYFKAM